MTIATFPQSGQGSEPPPILMSEAFLTWIRWEDTTR